MAQRKGQGDIVAIVAFLVIAMIIAISFLLFSYIFHTTATIFQPLQIVNSTVGQQAVTAMDDFGTSSLQQIFLFVFMGMLLALMISSFLVSSHPVFLIIYILLLVINIIIAIFAGNAYQMLNTGELAATYASQTIISTIMENIVRITLVASALSLILLFARLTIFGGGSSRGGSDGGL